MRTLALLILLSFACHANDDRQKLMERLVETSPGAAVRIHTLDGRKFNGRLIAVDAQNVRLQTVVKAEIREVELPLTEVRTFSVKSKEVTFGNEMKKSSASALVGLGFLAVLFGISSL